MTEPQSAEPETSEPLFNPFAPGFTDYLYPQYAAVRAAAPVYLHPMGFWLLTRYEDVSWLLRAACRWRTGTWRTARCSSCGRPPTAITARPFYGLSMLDRDPPDHTRLRKLVSKAFTPRAIEALRPRITELVDGMLDTVAQKRRVDSSMPSRSRCRSP